MSTHQERLNNANELIRVIASCGRTSFYHKLEYKGRVAYLERDGRGRIWFHDEGTQARIYTHYSGEWYRFSHGGTMRRLIEALRDYVVHDKPVPAHCFGPWPERVCGGDLWGYGEDMQIVRAAAARLGIVSEVKRVG